MESTISTLDLWTEGNSVTLNLKRINPTTIQIDWTLPTTYKAYDGAIVLLSEKLLDNYNIPLDGIRYTASQDFINPIDSIGGAQVVSSFYGAFQDDITQTSVTVSNVNSDKIYYASIHICTNILTYHKSGVKSYPLDGVVDVVNVDNYTGNIPTAPAPPLNPTLGQVYYNPSTNFVQMWNGSVWINASSAPIKTGIDFPTYPAPIQGDFFYNTNTRYLYIFNGTTWTISNTSQEGTPTYDKVPIGRTGSDSEKIRLINSMKLQLGYPAVCVELADEQFDYAIEYALSELRQRSDSAYRHKQILFKVVPDQNTYYLNDPRIATDKIVDIIKIQRLTPFGVNTISGDSGLFAQTFWNQMYSAGMVDILSIHIIASMGEEYTKIFAGNWMFEWNEMTREFKILRKIYREELVVLDTVLEKTEQELLTDRWVKNWILNMSVAKCYEMLGLIRGKYSSLPGPNGVSMNGDTLLQKSSEMMQELYRQLNDYEVGNMLEFGSVGILVG